MAPQGVGQSDGSRARVPMTASRAPRRSRSRFGLRTLLRWTVAGVGVLAGLKLIGTLWPSTQRDRAASSAGRPADLGRPPSRAVTVLLIGVDSDRLGDAVNRAAPPGPANADALLLVRVAPRQPLQVLTLPTNLAVLLPGQSRPQALGSLYRLGGPALSADAVHELLNLPPGEPSRFVVLSRGGLRQLVDGLGSVEANLGTVMRYSDRRQGLTIHLQPGLQRLRGQGVEQLVRFRDPGRADQSRLDQQQLVARGLLQELRLPHQVERLPGLSRSLLEQVNTNLSQAEVMSLLAAALSQSQPAQWQQLPLVPLQADDQGLRQLAAAAGAPLWPAQP